MRSSQNAVDMIVNFEVGGRASYNPHPCWPGGASGVTIGIGYDLGYADDIVSAWGPLLQSPAAQRLSSAAGITGDAARELATILSDITVPWDAAVQVFQERSIPKAEAETLSIFPNAVELPADCFGALVSLVYNRGTSLAGPRRVEMANIASMIDARQWAGVAEQIRAMRRLWPDVRGLRIRREAEAALYEHGLVSVSG